VKSLDLTAIVAALTVRP